MSKQEKLLAEKTVGLRPSGIRKFFDLVSEMKDAISLGVGEPDFDTPWHIRDEGIYSLEKGRTFYTSNSGLKELREEIAAYMRRTQGITYDPIGEILITVGGSAPMYPTSPARSWQTACRSSFRSRMRMSSALNPRSCARRSHPGPRSWSFPIPTTPRAL